MKKYDSISIIQVSLLIMTAIGLKNHVTVIPHLIGTAKRDVWVSVTLCTSNHHYMECFIGVYSQSHSATQHL